MQPHTGGGRGADWLWSVSAYQDIREGVQDSGLR